MTFRSPAWHQPRTRQWVSVLLIGHLIAVFIAPLSFQTRSSRGSSPSVDLIAGPVRGYGEFLYLNRGYAFFAPDPGPSHLIQAAIGNVNDKNRLREPVFPDRKRHRPRLLYHRHFMLAEYLTEIYQPPGPPAELAEIDPPAFEAWAASRRRYESVRQSFLRHLGSRHPDTPIAIRRLEHLIPDFLDFQVQSIELNDPSFFRVLTDRLPEDTLPSEALLIPGGPRIESETLQVPGPRSSDTTPDQRPW